MNGNEALRVILDALDERDVALFTTGYISRRAFRIKDREGNFYMLGSMGLLSSLGLGIALAHPKRRVVVVEGDGSALMSLSALPLVGHLAPKNFYHIVLDNGGYESTGGQRLATADTYGLAMVSGYRRSMCVIDRLGAFLRVEGPAFLLASVDMGGDVPGRVPLPPPDMTERLRRFLND